MRTKAGHAYWSIDIAILGLISLLAMFPMLSGCNLAAGHDFYFNYVSSEQFTKQLLMGDIYPRWMSDMNAGFGNPLFFYYGPLPFYLTGLIAAVRPEAIGSCQPLAWSFLLSLFLSGIFIYFYMISVVARPSAMVASIIYMLASYHLSIEIYTRCALAASWSYAWVALAFLFTNKLSPTRRLTTIGLGVSIGALALTHLPSLIIAYPFILGHALFKMQSRERRHFMCAVHATLLAIGISAAYWLPAFAMADLVSMQHMRGGFLEYSNNFLFEGPLAFRDVFIGYWRQIQSATLLMIAASLVAWLNIRNHAVRFLQLRHESNFMLASSLAAAVMTLPMSKFVWAAIPPLQRLQFPWRYNLILVFSTAVLAGMAVHVILASLERVDVIHRPILFSAVGFFCAVAIFTCLQSLCTTGVVECGTVLKAARVFSCATLVMFSVDLAIRFSPVTTRRILIFFFILSLGALISSQSYYRIMALRGESLYEGAPVQLAIGRPEHKPSWVPEAMFKVASLVAWSDKQPKVLVTRGSGSAAVRSWAPRRIQLHVAAASPMTFEIKQFFFPGWTAVDLDTGVKLPVRPSSNGLAEIGVAGGSHHLLIQLEPLPFETLGNILTATSLAYAFAAFVHGNPFWRFTRQRFKE